MIASFFDPLLLRQGLYAVSVGLALLSSSAQGQNNDPEPECPEHPATTAAPGLRVDCADNPIKIFDFTDESSFVGNFRIRAVGGGEVKHNPAFTATFLNPDLVDDSSGIRILRHRIALSSLSGPVKLGVPQDLTATVTGPIEAGVYTGQLQILTRDQNGKSYSAEIVKIELTAEARPLVTPVSNSLSIQFTDDQGLPGNGLLTRLLVPRTETENKVPVAFQNQGRDEPELVSRSIAVADANGRSLPSTAIDIQTGAFGRNSSASQLALDLVFERDQIPPGQYTGSLTLNFRNLAQPVSVSVDLKKRAGALVPALFLLIGLFGGRAAKYWQERGKPMADMLLALDRLEREIANDNRLTDIDRATLLRMVGELRLDLADLKSDDFVSRIEQLNKRRIILIDLTRIEGRLNEIPDPSARTKITEGIRQVRELVGWGKDSEALDKHKELIQEFIDALPPAANRATLTTALAWVDRATKETPSERYRLFARKVALFTTGISDRFPRHTIIWRVCIYSLTLMILWMIGLKTLYVEQGTTYGAQAFDFLGLILWGLSADIASRTLGNVGG